MSTTRPRLRDRARTVMAAMPADRELRRPLTTDRWLTFKSEAGNWWVVVCASPGVSAGVRQPRPWGIAGSMAAAHELILELHAGATA